MRLPSSMDPRDFNQRYRLDVEAWSEAIFEVCAAHGLPCGVRLGHPNGQLIQRKRRSTAWAGAGRSNYAARQGSRTGIPPDIRVTASRGARAACSMLRSAFRKSDHELHAGHASSDLRACADQGQRPGLADHGHRRAAAPAGCSTTPRSDGYERRRPEETLLYLRIPVDLGTCSGLIWAPVPAHLGAVGAERRSAGRFRFGTGCPGVSDQRSASCGGTSTCGTAHLECATTDRDRDLVCHRSRPGLHDPRPGCLSSCASTDPSVPAGERCAPSGRRSRLRS